MKNILALFVAVAFCFGMSGCGSCDKPVEKEKVVNCDKDKSCCKCDCKVCTCCEACVGKSSCCDKKQCNCIKNGKKFCDCCKGCPGKKKE